MKSYTIKSIALTATLFGSSYLSTGQDSAWLIPKVVYHRTGVEGTITGTITLTGNAPKLKRIDISADPVCEAMNSELLTEDAIVNHGKVANVFVYVKSGSALDRYSFEQPDSTVVLAHKECRYEPHVVALRVGQQLTISNSDPTHHNTHPQTKNNAEWNQTQAPDSPPLLKTFSRPEAFIPFKDNQHPWEKAYVGVFSHPFFAITDEGGRYRIEGLPPGDYTLVAWHERFGEKSIDLTISPGEVKDWNFTFDAAEHRY